ncbi:transposase, IS4 family [Ostertagia ostertagi]
MPLHFFDEASRRSRNVIYVRHDPRENLSENQSLIRQRFRFSDEQLDWITDLLSPMLGNDDQQPWAISKRMQVCIGIRYLCTNAFQVVVGDTAGCSPEERCPTSSSALSMLWSIQTSYNASSNLNLRTSSGAQPDPTNVIGAVDGTLVRLRTPAVDGFQYVSRKGTSSLNVCIIADAVGRILYVNSGSPGSVHDSHLWRNSSPAAFFSSGAAVPGYRLLGDKGYANGAGIITPFRPTAVQGDVRRARYNREHQRMRSIVEMTIGRLKSRFAILTSEMRVEPQKASKIVVACAVLHNISLRFNVSAVRQLGSRKATMAHPHPNVDDVRSYIVERI